MKKIIQMLIFSILIISCKSRIEGQLQTNIRIPKDLRITFSLGDKNNLISIPIGSDGKFILTIDKKYKKMKYSGSSYTDDYTNGESPGVYSTEKNIIDIENRKYIDCLYFVNENMNLRIAKENSGLQMNWDKSPYLNTFFSIRIYSKNDELLKEVVLKQNSIYLQYKSKNKLGKWERISYNDIISPIYIIDKVVGINDPYTCYLTLFHYDKKTGIQYIALQKIDNI